MTSATSQAAAIDRIFREESGKAVATLIRLFRDIDIAEEAVQEAFLVATERWPEAGLPPTLGDGSSPRLETAPSIVCDVSRPERTVMPKPSCSMPHRSRIRMRGR